MEPIYVEADKSRKDFFQREMRIKYHGGALRYIKLRLQDTFLTGGAG
jgi:hypothetical protein